MIFKPKDFDGIGEHCCDNREELSNIANNKFNEWLKSKEFKEEDFKGYMWQGMDRLDWSDRAVIAANKKLKE